MNMGRCRLTQSLDLDFSRRSFKSPTIHNIITRSGKTTFERKRTDRQWAHSRLLLEQLKTFESVSKVEAHCICTFDVSTVSQKAEKQDID